MKNLHGGNRLNLQFNRAERSHIESIIDAFQEGFSASLQWQMNLFNRIWLLRAIKSPSCEIWIGRIRNETAGVLILVNNYKEYLSFRKNLPMKLFYAACVFSPKVFLSLLRTVRARKGVESGENVTLKYAFQPKPGPKKNLSLEQIVVRTQYRGQGIANNLVAFAKERAKEEGFSNISLMVNRKNRPAYNLYLKNGFSSG